MNLEEERMLKGEGITHPKQKHWTLGFNYVSHTFACRLFFAFGICTFIKHFDNAKPSQQTHES
jgi:hypothetical protein